MSTGVSKSTDTQNARWRERTEITPPWYILLVRLKLLFQFELKPIPRILTWKVLLQHPSMQRRRLDDGCGDKATPIATLERTS